MCGNRGRGGPNHVCILYLLIQLNDILHATPTGKEKSREASIMLDFRVCGHMRPQLCCELVDGAACLEAKRAGEDNEVILPRVG